MESKDEVKYGSNLFCSVVSVGFIFWETWFPLPTIIIRRYSKVVVVNVVVVVVIVVVVIVVIAILRITKTILFSFFFSWRKPTLLKNMAWIRTRNLFLFRFFVSTWKLIVAINSLGGAFFSSCRQFFEIPRNVSLDVAAIYAVCGFKLGCLNNWH